MSLHKIRIQTVKIDDRLDAMRAVELRASIDAGLADGVSRFVVDLSDTTFVDSAGLAALAKGMKDARLRGGDLRVVASTHDDAARVFTLTRFDQVFVMGASADELVASW